MEKYRDLYYPIWWGKLNEDYDKPYFWWLNWHWHPCGRPSKTKTRMLRDLIPMLRFLPQKTCTDGSKFLLVELLQRSIHSVLSTLFPYNRPYSLTVLRESLESLPRAEDRDHSHCFQRRRFERSSCPGPWSLSGVQTPKMFLSTATALGARNCWASNLDVSAELHKAVGYLPGREQIGVHTCDRRSSRTDYVETFPKVDVSHVKHDEERIWVITGVQNMQFKETALYSLNATWIRKTHWSLVDACLFHAAFTKASGICIFAWHCTSHGRATRPQLTVTNKGTNGGMTQPVGRNEKVSWSWHKGSGATKSPVCDHGFRRVWYSWWLVGDVSDTS